MHLFFKKIARRFHQFRLREVAIIVLLVVAIPLTVVLVNSQKDIRQHASDSFNSCTDDSQCASGNTCFHYASYPGSCKPSDTVCTKAIVHACNSQNTLQCDDFPSLCVVPPGWTTGTVRGNPNPTFTASSNPCALKPDGTCSIKLSWNVPGGTAVSIKIKENPNIVWNFSASGSFGIDWITAAGATFELYSGGTLLDTITAMGVPQNTLKASNCVLNNEGTCKTTLFWSTDKNDLTIKLRENPSVVWNVPARGSIPVEWITAGGATFQLFSGETSLSTVFVKGIVQNKLSASPNPCSFQAQGTCTSTIYWNSDKTDITVTADPGVNTELLFGAGPVGAQAAPWINAQGVTFRLYSANTLLDTLVVKAVCAPPFCRLKPD